jgi:hypothetical protein
MPKNGSLNSLSRKSSFFSLKSLIKDHYNVLKIKT